MNAGFKDDFFFFHQAQAAVYDFLFQFEVRNAIAQQSARLGVPFKHGDGMAGGVELLGTGQAGRAGADDGHGLSGSVLRQSGAHPPAVESVFDDGFFDLFDGDRRFVDGEYAGLFAGGRAEAAGKFGKVVGGQQLLQGILPAMAVNRVVPVRDAVAQRAAGMTGGYAAIHAARGLGVEFVFGKGLVDFPEIADSLLYRTLLGQFSIMFHESRGFAHGVYSSCFSICARARLYSVGMTLTKRLFTACHCSRMC